jgi:preprotein translocase subunit SecA
MFGFVQKLFDNNDKEVKRIEREIVGATNNLESKMKSLPDLAQYYLELRQRHLEGGETLEKLMPEVFALRQNRRNANRGR